MITLHGMTLSNYYNKVKMVLLEKGVPFTEETVRTGSTDEAVLQASPLGKIPFIRVDGTPLCESQVIVDYLEARYPHAAPAAGRPAGRGQGARADGLCRPAPGTGGARSVRRRPSSAARSAKARKERVRKQLAKNIPAFKRLARFAPYLAGEQFTLADCAGWVSLPLVGMATKAVLGEDLLAGARHRLEELCAAGGRKAFGAARGGGSQAGPGGEGLITSGRARSRCWCRALR
jgi:glutathione S-transferase